MCNQSEWIVREAYRAYTRGDVERMMDFVHPALEWVAPEGGPEQAGARPKRGRAELAEALTRQASSGLRAEVEQVLAAGDKVLLVMRTPGLGQLRGQPGDDRTYDIVTVRDELIIGLEACRDRTTARSLIGIG